LAEEALQDSFVSIWHHASDYARAKGAPGTWMARSSATAASTSCAARANRRTSMTRSPSQLVDESAAPAREAEARADAHTLERCLAELDAEQRQSIALAFFHGLTHSELAAHLGRRSAREDARSPRAPQAARLHPARRGPSHAPHLGGLAHASRPNTPSARCAGGPAPASRPRALRPGHRRDPRRWEEALSPLAERVRRRATARVWSRIEERIASAAPRGAWSSVSFWRSFGLLAGGVASCCWPHSSTPRRTRSDPAFVAVLISPTNEARMTITVQSDALRIHNIRGWKTVQDAGRSLELWALPRKARRAPRLIANTGGDFLIRIPQTTPACRK
jgi:RNA polymerase sigma factor (sigma-70 family)